MAETVQLSRIAAIMLGVRDLPAAMAFYKDKLGLKVIMQEPALALLQCGNIMLGLSPRHMSAAPLAEAVEVSFGVDNLRATHKALGENGVAFLSEPRASHAHGLGCPLQGRGWASAVIVWAGRQSVIVGDC